MKLRPLAEMALQVKAGVPLPFGIRDAGGQLLLAKGHVVSDAQELAVLMARGATVEIEEAQKRGEAVAPPAENFPGRWHQLTVRAAVVLRPPVADDTLARVRELADQLIDMAERDADLLLYLALRSARDPGVQYGVLHVLHSAVICALLGRRAGWDAPTCHALVCAALTMNLSIVELQSRLVGSTQPLTQAQRERIDSHVADTLALLQQAGVDDPLWLRIVAEHHPPRPGAEEQPPPCEPARLLRLVDAYAGRIAERPDTIIASPALAARDLFTQHGKDPLALLLVKEMGVYPPGCHVRLVSGELAVVLRRGSSANAPLVAALTNKRGDALQTPSRRDTSILPEHHIASVVPDKDVRVRFQSQLLYK